MRWGRAQAQRGVKEPGSCVRLGRGGCGLVGDGNVLRCGAAVSAGLCRWDVLAHLTAPSSSEPMPAHARGDSQRRAARCRSTHTPDRAHPIARTLLWLAGPSWEATRSMAGCQARTACRSEANRAGQDARPPIGHSTVGHHAVAPLLFGGVERLVGAVHGVDSAACGQPGGHTQ